MDVFNLNLIFNSIQKIILNGDGLSVWKITKYISCYILDSEQKNECIDFVMKMCRALCFDFPF